jgi:hypothetical protein
VAKGNSYLSISHPRSRETTFQDLARPILTTIRGVILPPVQPKCLRLAALSLFFCAPVYAQVAQSFLPSPDTDPFVGTWRANALMSRPKLSKKDARYTRTIIRDGDERVLRSITEGDTSSARSYRIRCDGQQHNLPELKATMVCSYTSSNVVQGATRQNGGTGYWAEELSSDGKKMTVITYKDKARTKVKETLVLDRFN